MTSIASFFTAQTPAGAKKEETISPAEKDAATDKARAEPPLRYNDMPAADGAAATPLNTAKLGKSPAPAAPAAPAATLVVGRKRIAQTPAEDAAGPPAKAAKTAVAIELDAAAGGNPGTTKRGAKQAAGADLAVDVASKRLKTASGGTKQATTLEEASAPEPEPEPEEEPIEWRSEGHEWIGRRVARRFDSEDAGAEPTTALGKIVAWVPEEGEDEALWHMVHDDGDEEDLDEGEMREALQLAKQVADAKKKQAEMKKKQRAAPKKSKAAAKKKTAAPKQTPSAPEKKKKAPKAKPVRPSVPAAAAAVVDADVEAGAEALVEIHSDEEQLAEQLAQQEDEQEQQKPDKRMKAPAAAAVDAVARPAASGSNTAESLASAAMLEGLLAEMRALRAEVKQLRADKEATLAAVANASAERCAVTANASTVSQTTVEEQQQEQGQGEGPDAQQQDGAVADADGPAEEDRSQSATAAPNPGMRMAVRAVDGSSFVRCPGCDAQMHVSMALDHAECCGPGVEEKMRALLKVELVPICKRTAQGGFGKPVKTGKAAKSKPARGAAGSAPAGAAAANELPPAVPVLGGKRVAKAKSAYACFAHARRSAVLDEARKAQPGVQLSGAAAAKAVQAAWKALSAAEQSVFEAQAEQDKLRFDSEISRAELVPAADVASFIEKYRAEKAAAQAKDKAEKKKKALAEKAAKATAKAKAKAKAAKAKQQQKEAAKKKRQAAAAKKKSTKRKAKPAPEPEPEEEPIEWRSEGHEWIGRRVARRFDSEDAGAEPTTALGKIVAWVPEEGEDEALWHMVHDDGDEEDLDEGEMREALQLCASLALATDSAAARHESADKEPAEDQVVADSQPMTRPGGRSGGAAASQGWGAF